jgi:hypothetical protein
MRTLILALLILFTVSAYAQRKVTVTVNYGDTTIVDWKTFDILEVLVPHDTIFSGTCNYDSLKAVGYARGMADGLIEGFRLFSVDGDTAYIRKTDGTVLKYRLLYIP